ncbi:amphoterin-induced protein 2-like [Acipenser ruthenus]|uniref:amphoterin-induced protein 2-like n=1 Tax=Acipenser ruthenus TaxID=7906 RepID=UPI001560D910|nr:amphoterin-induced protein 2-like [Acipenser ruthenus]
MFSDSLLLPSAYTYRSVRSACKNILFALLLCANLTSSAFESCPTDCICASDIITCSNKNLPTLPRIVFQFISRLDVSYNRVVRLNTDWAPNPLDKLNTLILSHNSISHITTGVFSNTPNVRYLDLSSNKLSSLSETVFQDLTELEVLLLFNNAITQIKAGAFGGLHALQKLYLSRNLITQFPLEVLVGKLSLSHLELLDLSLNSLREVPVQKIISLPASQQHGLYLHDNPFTCDCTLYTMLMYWYKRQFRPVVDFKSDYNCFFQPHLKVPINLFSQSEDFMNCANSTINGSFHYLGMIYEVSFGDRLVVHCDSKIIDGNSVFSWVTPSQELVQPGNHSQNLNVFVNGSLEVSHAQIEDSGVYTCIVINSRRKLNETIEVTIKVSNSTSDRSRSHGTFSTAFTTLAACVASIILVLIYLYLTPCRCCCRTRKTKRKPNLGSASSFILSTTPSSDTQPNKKASTGKRVVFLEPGREPKQGQNGKIKLLPADQVITESILKNSKTKSESDSVNSFSDTPFLA